MTFLRAAVSILAIGHACTAYAQSAPVASDSNELDEIIVTAQRRSENVQKAAVPIAVVSADALRRAGVSSPDALTALVPSLTITSTGSAAMTLFVRGVGNFTLSPSFDSAVAFNYDNVYIGRPAGTSGFFYDLERIEVLKGPQGTLYGRNATGGAINVIPNKPVAGEFSGFLNAGFGNYDAVTLEGAINVPMGENGALRVSGNLNKHDGYLSDGTSDADAKSLRVQMMGELTPNLSVRVAADYTALRGKGVGGYYTGGYAFNGVGYTDIPSPLSPSVGLYDPRSQAYRRSFFVVPAGRFLDDRTAQPYLRNNYYGVSGEIKLQTGAGDLTIIPSIRISDTATISASYPFVTETGTDDEQYSLEARFAGKRIGIFEYTLGAMYFKETQDLDLDPNQSTLNTYQYMDLSAETMAVFARVTAHLNDRLRLVGGARFTRDKKFADATSENVTVICTTLPTPCFNAPLLPLTDDVSDLGIVNLPPQGAGGIVPYLDANGVPVPGVLISRSPFLRLNQGLKKNSFTWRAGVEFDAAPQSLLYATVETGFRVGGLQPVNGPQAIYKPEKITAFTIGSKNRFFGNRVQLNIEGFLWKYKDQQIAALGIDNVGTPSFFVQNVGKSTAYGTEIELDVAATPTTRLSANVQYLFTEYDRFTYDVPQQPPAAPYVGCPNTPGINANGSAIYTFDCSGKAAFNSPRWTINLAAMQTIPLGEYELVASVDSQFRSSRWIGYEYLPSMLQGSTWQTRAQLEFGPKDGNWTVTAYVRNIENDRFDVNSVNYSFGSLTSAATNAPRTYGVRLGAKF